MKIQELCQSLKLEWLRYYKNNRHWLEKMEIWATFEGERRPLSSFVLATVTVLEPSLIDILPLLADLNSDPDALITALGLNFSPEKYLHLVEIEDSQLLDKVNDDEINSDFEYVETTNNTYLSRNLETCSQLENSKLVNQKLISPKLVNTKPKIQVAVAKSYLNRGKTKSTFTTSVIPMTDGTTVTPIVAFATTIKGKGSIVKIIHDKVPSEINQSPVLHPRNLANWIDDFCQGRGWDKDEATFIPF
ncbi:MAG: DUF5331 domain-containing protein [Methylacidiphilales bacterium]|nr:DUF5331 domain-containing protein [Candidatus Methylacidiphilales bacterium]NJR17256.1 DUF5331 domain-containing protein [Calothrix sp. CSU_2_0]